MDDAPAEVFLNVLQIHECSCRLPVFVDPVEPNVLGYVGGSLRRVLIRNERRCGGPYRILEVLVRVPIRLY